MMQISTPRELGLSLVPETVPSCHSPQARELAPADSPVVAIVGNPNVGKSSLFNVLTGARREIGNWPGTTVEVGRGAWRWGSRTVALLDLPGAVSLDPVSPDEALTRALLVETSPEGRPDLVVVVLDAAHLTRCLYLLAEIRETTQRAVIALTMTDVAAKRDCAVDVGALAEATGIPVAVVDPRRGTGLEELVRVASDALVAAAPAARPGPAACCEPADTFGSAALDAPQIDEERFAWIMEVTSRSVRRPATPVTTWSDRIDRVATAPVLGPLAFLAVMWVVFQVTTRLAAPLQDALDTLVNGPVAAFATGALAALGLGGTWVEGLLIDGLVAGVGMLLTFVPVMALMFALLALLESSGYLARAAVVTDRTMRRIGLPGRAFLPLIVGFGCNVPAISATRILPDARHRILTALLVPFTSCSARLAVYVLVGAAFFGDRAGDVVFAMYVTSILVIVAVGLGLRSTLWRTVGADPFVIDLPPYHLPLPRQVLGVTWMRVRGFLRTAGGIIVGTVCAVWLLSSIPVGGATGTFGNVPVEDSAYAAAARAVAPVFSPAGFGEWHATSALMTGFVAKEAVISSWAQTYALEQPADSTQPGVLGAQLVADFEASSGGHTTAAVLAFLVFLLAYTPCVATIAAQRREMGGRWTLFSLGLSMGVAYALAVAVFQVGRLFV